jgi:deoxyadenosine/deoxycytidine kinase
LKWFNHFAADLPVKGIIHLATSASTSKDRIGIRGRTGEESIPIEYLNDLDEQHQTWIRTSNLPTIQITTEPGSDTQAILEQIKDWLKTHFKEST